MDYDFYDIEDPRLKQSNRGGGGGIGGPGPGPAGGFIAYAGGGNPGMSAGGYDYLTPGAGAKSALMRKIMEAIQAMEAGDTVNARLTPGEFVMNPRTVQMPGMLPALRQANDEGNQFFLGGLVDKLNLPDWANNLGKGALKWGATAGLAAIPGVGLPLAAAASQALMNGGEYSSVREGLTDMGGAAAAELSPDALMDLLPDRNPVGGTSDLSRGMRRRMTDAPQSFAYGGFVRPTGRYGGSTAGAQTSAYTGSGSATSGASWRARIKPRPMINLRPGLPTPPPANPPANPQDPGPGSDLPTTAIDALLRKYASSGMFDPEYGMQELEASLTRQNQGAQEADVRDLMASGLDDPSLYAAQLLQSRGARSKQASSTMADARLKQIQSAQDWARELLGARHADQINELLKRIK